MLGSICIALALATAVLAEGETVPARVPTVDEVLQRHVEACGGREAIEALSNRHCRGRVVTDLSWTDPRVTEARFEAWTGIPDRYRMVSSTKEGEILEVYDGRAGWKRDATGIQQDDKLGRSKLAWLLNPRNALRLQEYFPELRVTGRSERAGRAVWNVESATRNPAHWLLSFDVETGLLAHIGYYWDLEDFREVDGVLFPFRVVCSRKGGSSTYYFDEVRHDVPAGDSLFARPAS